MTPAPTVFVLMLSSFVTFSYVPGVLLPCTSLHNLRKINKEKRWKQKMKGNKPACTQNLHLYGADHPSKPSVPILMHFPFQWWRQNSSKKLEPFSAFPNIFISLFSFSALETGYSLFFSEDSLFFFHFLAWIILYLMNLHKQNHLMQTLNSSSLQ